MGKYEIELYFAGTETEEPYMTITPVECVTGTELEFRANYEFKKQGAIGVSFGPAVQRGADGLPE